MPDDFRNIAVKAHLFQKIKGESRKKHKKMFEIVEAMWAAYKSKPDELMEISGLSDAQADKLRAIIGPHERTEAEESDRQTLLNLLNLMLLR